MQLSHRTIGDHPQDPERQASQALSLSLSPTLVSLSLYSPCSLLALTSPCSHLPAPVGPLTVNSPEKFEVTRATFSLSKQALSHHLVLLPFFRSTSWALSFWLVERYQSSSCLFMFTQRTAALSRRKKSLLASSCAGMVSSSLSLSIFLGLPRDSKTLAAPFCF